MKNEEKKIVKMIDDNFRNSSIDEIKRFIRYHNIIVSELTKLLCEKYDELIKGEELPF